jgi:hypothetical protein
MSERLEKRCSKCGIVKPIEQFSRQRQPNGQEGRRSHCKDCIKVSDAAYLQANYEKKKAYQSAYRLANYEKARAKERGREERHRSKPGYRERQAEWSKTWRAQNPGYAKADRLKRNYNLTEQEYQQMYQAQGGLCAICGNPQIPSRRLAVDHDHQSGLVRGLLCHYCNAGIGHFGDDISRLESAIAYLRRFQLDTDVS